MPSAGFDMYVTEDGVNFTTLTTNGFNDPYNHGLRTFAVTNQGLCLGTANPFYGCQVWIQRKENSENPIDPGTPDPTKPTNPSQPGGGDQPGGSQTAATTSRAAPRPPSRRPLRRLRRTARCLTLATRPSRWSWDCWLQLPRCLALPSSCASVLVARRVRAARCF